MKSRIVPDTNVVIASRKSPSPLSPSREILDRWTKGEFDLLYSLDTIIEYVRKCRETGISAEDSRALLTDFTTLGILVTVSSFHERVYPADPDDIAFLLCATNGDATHLITYDSDFEPVRDAFPFSICTPVEFLREHRKSESY
jgi:predicted nucleic acid-binding protein